MAQVPKAGDSDDELIARLRKAVAEGGPPKHDSFFDLVVAKEVPAKGAAPPVSDELTCTARARRVREVPGLMSYPVTEQIQCELQEGHPGDHRACFKRSRFRHRWSALEWPSTGRPASV